MTEGTYKNALPSILVWLHSLPDVVAAVSVAPSTAEPRIYGERVPGDPILTTSTIRDEVGQLAPTIVIASVPGFREEVPVFHPRWELRAYAPRQTAAKNLIEAAIGFIDGKSYRDFERGVYVTLTLSATPGVGPDPDGFVYASCFFDSTVLRFPPRP